MNRERPTGTERKSLNYECGWKGGDRGGLAERKKTKALRESDKRVKTLLTRIGLLMEGLSNRKHQKQYPGRYNYATYAARSRHIAWAL